MDEVSPEERKQRAISMMQNRVLTPADFEKIKQLQVRVQPHQPVGFGFVVVPSIVKSGFSRCGRQLPFSYRRCASILVSQSRYSLTLIFALEQQPRPLLLLLLLLFHLSIFCLAAFRSILLL